MEEKIRIGIIGCGTIGSEIARAVHSKFGDVAELSALSDDQRAKGTELVKELGLNIPVCLPDEVIELSDMVVEAANASVARSIASAALVQNKYVLIMSVGGLIDAPEVFQLTNESRGRLYIPSGEVAGIDAVKAAAEGKIESVRLTVKGPPGALAGATYIEENEIDLKAIESEKIVFEGPAARAVKGFPKIINVSAALSFAGIGPEKTEVRVIASPELRRIVCEIEVDGSFGKMLTRTVNIPSAASPDTSSLAVLSAVAMLRRILYALKVGT
jgi:aspartate dehydrogenase